MPGIFLSRRPSSVKALVHQLFTETDLFNLEIPSHVLQFFLSEVVSSLLSRREYRRNSDSLMIISRAFAGFLMVSRLIEFRELKRKCGLIWALRALSSDSLTNVRRFPSFEIFSLKLLLYTIRE